MLAMPDTPHILATAETLGTGLLAKGFLDKTNLTSVILFMAAAMIIFWVLFRARHARRRGRRLSQPTQQQAARSTATAAATPPELDRWNVEMHETARELSAQLDTKMVVLQTLIRNAQQEQAKLQELLDKVEEKRK